LLQKLLAAHIGSCIRAFWALASGAFNATHIAFYNLTDIKILNCSLFL